MWLAPICAIIGLFILIIGSSIILISRKFERFSDTGIFIGRIVVVFGLVITIFMVYSLFTTETSGMGGYSVHQDLSNMTNETTILLFETKYENYTIVNIGGQDGAYHNLTVHGFGQDNITVVTLFSNDLHLYLVEISPELANFEFIEIERDWDEYYSYELVLNSSTETFTIIFEPEIWVYNSDNPINLNTSPYF